MMLSAVTPFSDGLEFTLQVGGHTLHLRAFDATDRLRWLNALNGYVNAHSEEREEARRRIEALYTAKGVGIRDLDARSVQESRCTISGFLHRQDPKSHAWRRWWCRVEDGALLCTAYDSLHLTDGADIDSVTSLTSGSLPYREVGCVALPVVTATVREARSLPLLFAFEVISPRESLLLQAQSQEEMHLWMGVMQNATASLLGCGASPSSNLSEGGGSSVLATVHAVAGNDCCCDCAAPNPTWASINLGVVMCLACAGIHRQLGVHISKVRGDAHMSARPTGWSGRPRRIIDPQ